MPEGDKQTEDGKSLIGQLAFAELAAKTAGVEALTARLDENAEDHDARFDMAVCLIARHDYADAADHLFDGRVSEVGDAIEDLLGDFET